MARRSKQMNGWLTLPGGEFRVEEDSMSVKKVQIGQLWKKNDTPDTYLVTRVYMEALSTIAVLRKSGSEGEDLIRVKVERTIDGQTLTGFVAAVDDGSM
jgi:hypothetical protein